MPETTNALDPLSYHAPAEIGRKYAHGAMEFVRPSPSHHRPPAIMPPMLRREGAVKSIKVTLAAHRTAHQSRHHHQQASRSKRLIGIIRHPMKNTAQDATTPQPLA